MSKKKGIDWPYFVRQLDLAFLFGGIGGRPKMSEKEYKRKRRGMIEADKKQRKKK